MGHLDVSIVNDSFIQQLLLIYLPHIRMLSYQLIHQWLREHRLIQLIMSQPPVPDDVNDDFMVEFLAELGCYLAGDDDVVDAVCVDVEDGGVDAFAEVGGVLAGAGVDGAGGEADLVVGDDVDCAAGAVTIECTHLN